MPLDPPRKQELLATPINKLGLNIPGSRLEPLVNQLYSELESAGLVIRPECYFSDEWGCPHGIPLIGIPFYLATKELSALESEMTGSEAETDEEIMKYLRHEAGHAFNYGYRLYELPDWRTIFGPFARPYREDYRPKLFDPRFARHLPGWYAQKHPDEDFAETFALVVTPSFNWQEAYASTPVLEKLTYVKKTIEEHRSSTPMAFDKVYDYPVDELTETLAQWYQEITKKKYKIALHPLINEDLRQIFGQNQSDQPAAQLIKENHSYLIYTIHNWTGKNNIFVEEAVDEILKRVQSANLTVAPGAEKNTLINLAVFLTILIINHLHTMESFVL